jgi:signal transduction histidine kinase
VRASLQLDRHLVRAGQAVAYLVVDLLVALLAIPAVLAVVLGAMLTALGGIGLPVLLLATKLCRWVLRLDRRAANRLLATQIPPLPGGTRTSGTLWRRSVTLLSDRGTWRIVAALAVHPPLVAGFVIVGLAPVVLLSELVSLGVQGVGGLGDIDYLGPWRFGGGVGIVLCLLALPAAVLAVATLDALRTLLCTTTRALLAPRAAPAGPVREMLAASLGDHSVNIVYWLPDRETFVDESGRKVEMPEPGSGRAWTAVEQDGRRVAAIVHDVALDTSPELVHAAAAASSLAIDNERLKADLRARLEELRVSRLRIVEAADAARRRIERDLHDGAQQQLVSLSLQLRVLKARLKSDPELQDLVDQLSDQLARALEELRELARGIHPAVLTDHGLGPAIAALADRVPIDVDSQLSTDERMPAPVEAAAYFVVAEALTNVVKYAQANRALVDIRRRNDDLWVTVSDDGVGGASIGAGSGLRGLQDRVAAVGGTLTVASAPGRGTRLTARLPCGRPAAAPVAPEQDGSVVGA